MVGISIFALIILLGVLIFVHELGHFLAAKRAGVGVEKFSLGFGPKLFGKKIGETEYLLSLIPLGGYVKLAGESEGEIPPGGEASHYFNKRSVYVRFAIVAAGPLFNLLLAVLIFSAVGMIGLPVLTAKIGGFTEISPANEAGIRQGDIVLAIDGREVSRWDRMAEIIRKSGGKELALSVLRGEERREITIKPRAIIGKNIFGEEMETYVIGITPAPDTVVERANPVAAVYRGFVQTWNMTKLTVLTVVKMVQGIVSPKTLGGPILIAQIAGSQVKEGLIPFILFMAVLSINLAILNLLPVPVLDGGHLLFFLIEMIRGREIGIKWRERAQQVGLALIVMLMLFVIFMDIERLNLDIFK